MQNKDYKILSQVISSFDLKESLERGFNGSVNIPESCDFRSQFDPLNIICSAFFIKYFFVGIYILNKNV